MESFDLAVLDEQSCAEAEDGPLNAKHPITATMDKARFLITTCHLPSREMATALGHCHLSV